MYIDVNDRLHFCDSIPFTPKATQHLFIQQFKTYCLSKRDSKY